MSCTSAPRPPPAIWSPPLLLEVGSRALHRGDPTRRRAPSTGSVLTVAQAPEGRGRQQHCYCSSRPHHPPPLRGVQKLPAPPSTAVATRQGMVPRGDNPHNMPKLAAFLPRQILQLEFALLLRCSGGPAQDSFRARK